MTDETLTADRSAIIEPERAANLTTTKDAAAGASRTPTPWRDALALRLLARCLPGHFRGRLDLTLPGGSRAALGTGLDGATASLRLARYGTIRAIWQRGAIGFSDSYIAGDAQTDDLGAVFRFCLDNEDVLWAPSSPLRGSRWTDRLYHRLRPNTRTGSKRNISAHYDLGNAFYRAWLDPGMTYSSGIYRAPADDLATAQTHKYAAILDALDLDSSSSLLEIGCGWGGLAEVSARAGANVTALTISREQFAYARERIAVADLCQKVDVRFEDYRDTRGTFDRIASIEMIEAVGEKNWPTYFGILSERLAPGGVAVLQAITIAERYFADYRRNPDFIQRYIFPGGMLPTVSGMRDEAERAGLTFENVERFGASYALTLRDWRERFETAWPKLAQMGFDERFRRLWQHYLVYCEVGFERGTIDVGLYRLRKP